MKVLVADNISPVGIDALKREKGIETDIKLGLSEQELAKIIHSYDALLVRSAVKVTKPIIDAASCLKIIGRAGVGVDNIDAESATKKGIIVMNTPFGNTISAAEHTMAMMLSLARNIPQADKKLKEKQWDRKTFTGTELKGKTLGVVGIGKVGKEVAIRAKSFGMLIIAYDPYISKVAADEQEITLKDLPAVLKESDFITIHTPLTPQTKDLISEKEFSIMKPTARIINCARGGIINERALIDALKKGIIKGAALDVFEEEPPLGSELLTLSNTITTPHLGASTEEAQTNVSKDLADQIIEYHRTGRIINAVNIPQIHPDSLKKTAPYLKLAEDLGTLAAYLPDGHLTRVEIKYTGDIATHDTRYVTISAIKGLLAPICGPAVNYINAPYLARERKIDITESKKETQGDYTSEITLTTQGNTVSGILLNNKPRITRINDFDIDLVPEGHILLVPHQDIAGTLAEITSVLGKSHINIARMSVGRTAPGKSALAAINIDQPVPKPVLEEIKRQKNVNGSMHLTI